VSGFAGKGVVIAGRGRGFGLVCARLIAYRGRSASLIGRDSALRRRAREALQDGGW
jgi:hypothetical protein